MDDDNQVGGHFLCGLGHDGGDQVDAPVFSYQFFFIYLDASFPPEIHIYNTYNTVTSFSYQRVTGTPL